MVKEVILLDQNRLIEEDIWNNQSQKDKAHIEWKIIIFYSQLVSWKFLIPNR